MIFLSFFLPKESTDIFAVPYLFNMFDDGRVN